MQKCNENVSLWKAILKLPPKQSECVVWKRDFDKKKSAVHVCRDGETSLKCLEINTGLCRLVDPASSF